LIERIVACYCPGGLGTHRGHRGAETIWNSPAFGLIGIGFYLAISIVGLTMLGRWLDGRFGTEPVLTLVFLALGLVVGFYGAYTQLRDVLRLIAERQRRGGRR
jgi:hypothetical protein